MTPEEYHARYGITTDDLRSWIKQYDRIPIFEKQVKRWKKALEDLEPVKALNDG